MVYLVAALGVIHYLWLVKKDLTAPLIYGAVLGLLLVMRLPWVATLLQKARSRLAQVMFWNRSGGTRFTQ